MEKIINTKTGSPLLSKKPKILIIGGRGKFGSLFVRFFEKENIPVIISGRDDSLEIMREKVSKSDIVIVSVPISKTSEIIKSIRDSVRDDALLCDFTSIKTSPIKEMLKTKSKCGITGIHPMFGPLVSSMNDQTIVFCKVRDNIWSEYLRSLFKENGAKIVESTPKEHDEKMAVIQAFTHFINILFGSVLTGENTEKLNMYSSPVFRMQSILSARVLGGKSDLYADIAIENPAFIKLLRKFDKTFIKFKNAIFNGNKNSYEKIYNDSAKGLLEYVPIAQRTSAELMHIIDRQFIGIKSENPTYSDTEKISNKKVYILGPEGTFSHIAANKIFSNTEIVFNKTIRDVFESIINSNDNSLGLVPIENSTQGIVQESLDCFTKLPVNTIGSYKMPINLCLIGSAKDMSQIVTIKSHPQPLAQSRNWIRDNFPNASIETTASSAEAMLQNNNSSIAFIGSEEAGKKYNLNILAKNIQDNKNNVTEFYIISKDKNSLLSKEFKASKTAIILVVHDRPGVLRDILDTFAKRKLNLTKLHSKSSDLEDYSYYFYLEIEGLAGIDRNMDEALKEIDQYCYIKQILGLV